MTATTGEESKVPPSRVTGLIQPARLGVGLGFPAAADLIALTPVVHLGETGDDSIFSSDRSSSSHPSQALEVRLDWLRPSAASLVLCDVTQSLVPDPRSLTSSLRRRSGPKIITSGKLTERGELLWCRWVGSTLGDYVKRQNGERQQGQACLIRRKGFLPIPITFA